MRINQQLRNLLIILAWELFAFVEVGALVICFCYLLPSFEDFYQRRPLPYPTIIACNYVTYLWWLLLVPIFGWLFATLKLGEYWMWVGIGLGCWLLWVSFWFACVAVAMPFARLVT